jgi:uncharacterized protein
MKCFPREIHKSLKWYVYRLIDPCSGCTFYVGKGRGDRVFQHVQGALKVEDTETDIDLKTKMIKEIEAKGENVLYVIHRHGIETEGEAYLVEAALIDAYPGLANIVGGHASTQYGCQTVKQIIDAYEAEELKPEEPLILIFVGRTREEGRSIYDAVRAAWRMQKQKAEKYKLILAYNIQGIVEGAFRPRKWLPATKQNFPFLLSDMPDRIGFEGDPADDVESLYLGKKAPARAKGSMSPFRYLD